MASKKGNLSLNFVQKNREVAVSKTNYQEFDFGASEAFQALSTYVFRGDQDCLEASLERFERGLHEHLMALESEIMACKVAQLDVQASEIDIEGRQYRFKMTSTQTYTGLSGSFTVERNLYVPRSGEGKAVAPLDLRAGMVEGRWTPLAARTMALAVQGSTPKEAARLFEELGGMRPSTSTLDRIPKHLSEKWEAKREEFENDLRSQETIPGESSAISMSIDAVKVPMKDGGRSEKRRQENKRPKGPAGYKDVGCGEVSYYNDQGNRLETYRYARMPEAQKVVLRAQLLAEVEAIVTARPDLKVVALSDGAEEHWRYFREICEELGLQDNNVVEVLDFFHAMERIKKAIDTVHGEGSHEGKLFFEQCRMWLRECEDGAERVIRALEYRKKKVRGPKRKHVEREINYVKTHKGRMRYSKCLEANLPIGSGVVEATCKTLATERMKRSGMSWLQEGGQAILTLRSLVQSNRWNNGWQLLAAEYRARVRLSKVA